MSPVAQRLPLFADDIEWDELVISRYKDGTVRSRFGENVWSVEEYRVQRTDPRALNFERLVDAENPGREKVVRQCKQLFFMLWKTHDRYGEIIKISTAASYLIFLNSLVCRIEFDDDGLFGFLSSAEKVRNFANNIEDAWTLKGLLTLFNRMKTTKCELINFKPAFSSIPFLKKIKKEISYDSTQHPVIPTRILLNMIVNYQGVINQYLDMRPRIEEFIYRVSSERNFARGKWSRRRAQKKSDEYLPLISFREAIICYGLEEVVERYNLLNVNHFTRYLTLVQYCCKMMIHVFSGMRSSEGYSIDIGGYEVKDVSYGKVCSLIGVTTKLLTGMHTSTERWITSTEVENAVAAAESIAGIVYKFNNATYEKALFVSTCHLPFARNLYDWPKDGRAGDELYSLAALNPYRYEKLLPEIVITEEDRKELQMSDYSRDWGAEAKFQIGKRWPLTIHQLRRSLCVYAARSELVTLASLKQLMKHVTSQMTLYYMKGFALSENLINPSRNHVMHEIAREKPYAESILYAKEILMSEEKLWGSAGKYLNNADFVSGIRIMESWEATVRQCKSGQLSYRSTMVGGCMTRKPCKKRGYVSMVGCIGCDEGVIVPWKVKRARSMQFEYVQTLDQESVEYRTQIDILIYLDRLLSSIKST